MNTSNNTVLITGGATGIGLALAESFLKENNSVIICGRREHKLEEAKRKLPGIHARRCDITKEGERRELERWVSSEFNEINILVNNAGIQRLVDLKKSADELLKIDDEIEINLKSQIHLTAHFIPLLSKQRESAIINVSSGLGFVPLAIAPIYSATKAGFHSFTVSLRHQLKNTRIKVFELIPPVVDTELDMGTREKRGIGNIGISPKEVADAAMEGLKKDEYEIAVGRAKGLAFGTKDEKEQAFKNMNGW